MYATTQFRVTSKLYRGQKHFLEQEKSTPTDGHYSVRAHHYGALIQARNECNQIL
jgi:hypothetical protein